MHGDNPGLVGDLTESRPPSGHMQAICSLLHYRTFPVKQAHPSPPLQSSTLAMHFAASIHSLVLFCNFLLIYSTKKINFQYYVIHANMLTLFCARHLICLVHKKSAYAQSNKAMFPSRRRLNDFCTYMHAVTCADFSWECACVCLHPTATVLSVAPQTVV
jgi:hypothetical protein